MVLKAAELSNLISSVRDSISSLQSCKANEVENEARVLQNVLQELEEARPLRRNSTLETRKAFMMEAAKAVLAARKPYRVTAVEVANDPVRQIPLADGFPWVSLLVLAV